jgi:type IV pilus assembly protein PilY1
MTFSKPRVVKVRYRGADVDALIFAGGYDTNKDSTPTDEDGSRGADAEGNAIYVVNARTGGLIWKATHGATTGTVDNTQYRHTAMLYSIPSEVTVLDSDRNGIVDRLYVGDMRGQIWRADLPEGDDPTALTHRRDNWSVSLLANLSGAADAYDRRFFHRPDVIQTRDGNGPYDAIVIASGDRANPLESTDLNQLYVIKDRNVVSGKPPGLTLRNSDLTDVSTCTTTCTSLTYDYGWKMDLAAPGEKGLSSPLVTNGKIFLTTYVPNVGGGNSCAPAEGSGNIYVVQLADGSESFAGSRTMEIGPGIPASPIALSGDLVLLPGKGLGTVVDAGINSNGKLVNIDGRNVWRLFWRAAGKDKI